MNDIMLIWMKMHNRARLVDLYVDCYGNNAILAIKLIPRLKKKI